MNNFINIHSHQKCNPDTICIINIFANEMAGPQIDSNKYYSIGLHPWHINTKSESIYEKNIQKYLIHPNIIAIGETGLDRITETSYELQEKIFKQHVKLSEQNNLPMILHCVKAYNDLIRIRKETNAMQPWILHAYKGNLETSVQLLKHDFYFSFGSYLKDINQKQLQSIRQISTEKIFFETDDNNSEVSDIYKLYCSLENLDLETVKLQIANNFKRCFGFEHRKY